MLFDKLCGLVERHLPEWRDTIEKARLFHFPGNPHEFLPKGPEAQPADESLFFLPFDTIAVEDNASVVLLQDTLPEQRGLTDSPRLFLEALPARVQRECFRERDDRAWSDVEGAVDMFPDDTFILSAGCIHSIVPAGWKYLGQAEPHFLKFVSKKHGVVWDLPGHEIEAMGATERFTSNALAAIEEMVLLSAAQDHFVLEAAPATPPQRKGKARDRLLRSHERPVFTMLPATEIRRRLNLDAPGSATEGRKSPRLHERRRHIRKLIPGEGKPWKQEKEIFVPATWVGESEKREGNKIYRVRLDV